MSDETTIQGDAYGLISSNQGTIIQNFNMAHVPGQPHLPLQRPPRATHFTDRKDELAQLLADLQPGQVATLCGPGGIGKSALAAEAIWQLAPEQAPPSQFPDGILFHTFYNQPQADLALEHFVRSFGGEARPTPRQAALQLLDDKQALLVLDGTEDADDLEAILAIRGGCGVLVTSRRHEDAAAAWQDMPPLPPAEAVLLLQKWAGSLADDEAAALAVCDLVGYLPLAVRLVGRYLAQRSQPVADYLEWLAATPLEALDHKQKRDQSVPYLIKKSLDQLPAEATEILAVVGQLALAPFTIDVIDATLDYPQPLLRHHLGELVNYGLLLAEAGLYQVTHALVHTYASKRLPVAAAAFSQLVAYCDAYAQEQSQLGLAGFQHLHGMRPHLLQLQETCLERGEWQAARSLVWAARDFFDLQGIWAESIQLIRAGITAAQQSDNTYDEVEFLNYLGIAYRALGQAEAAIGYIEQALVISQEIGDKQHQGNSLGNLGNAYAALGHVEAAIGYHEQALAISQEIDDKRGEGIDLGNLGNAYVALGQVEAAISYYEQALAIAQEIGDKRGEGAALGNLGNAYAALGHVEAAISYTKQALAIAQEMGNKGREGDALCNLGVAYTNLGQVEAAIGYYEQALAIAQEIGDKKGEALDLNNLGVIFKNLGQVEAAIGYFEQALAIAQEIGDKKGQGSYAWNLGLRYEETDPAKAVALMSIMVAYEQEIGYPDAAKHAEWVARIQAKLDEEN